MDSRPRHGQEPTGVSMTETVVERNAITAHDSGVHGLEEVGKAAPPKSTSDARPPATPLQAGAYPPVIPPPQPDRQRTLVLCFDGTGDQFDADNSNIVQLVALLKKDDRSKQMVYYQVCRHHSLLLSQPAIGRCGSCPYQYHIAGGHRDIHFSEDCFTMDVGDQEGVSRTMFCYCLPHRPSVETGRHVWV